MALSLPLSKDVRPMGKSGLASFPLAFGTMGLNPESVSDAVAVTEHARSLGFDQIDSADIYGYKSPLGFGSIEALLGKARAASPETFKGTFTATKGGINKELGAPYVQSREYITSACEASLKRLGVETIDLYYIHRPDMLTHPEELAGALEALKAAGKIQHIGVSNFTSSQVSALASYLDSPIVAHQLEISPFEISPMTGGLLDQCMEMQIAPIAWSPLGHGRLITGNTEGLSTDKAARLLRIKAVIDAIALKHRTDNASVCLAFLLAHPAKIIPITGTIKTKRLDEAVAALECTLDREDWYSIIEAYNGVRMP